MEGDPDACADHELAARDPDRLREDVQQPPRNSGGMRLVRPVQQQGKLVAAQPRKRVARPAHLREPLRNRLEELVAGIVAEAVVHLLEPVEVDEQNGERAARAGRAGERLLQAVAEECAVGQHGETVVEGLPRELFLQANALGDVPRVQHHAADAAVGAEVGDVRLEVAPLAEAVLDAEDGFRRLGAGAGRADR